MENSHLVPFSSARAQLYAMQAQAQAQVQAGGMVQQTPQHIIRWLTLRDSQANVQNASKHTSSILSLSDSPGAAECSPSASLYPRALSQAADLQLTSQSDHTDAQTLSQFRLGQLYQFEQQYMQVKDNKANLDSGNENYPSAKVEEDQICQEMAGNFGFNDVTSASGWPSAYPIANPTSIAPPSAIQVPLNQRTIVANMLGRPLAPQENEGMMSFEGTESETTLSCAPHGETPLQVQGHNVLSLASNFDNCPYNN